MDESEAKVIERYQLMLEQDPKSKVFAPLAEAYRKQGMLKEALETCLDGVKRNPNFASGRVALAKIYMEQKKFSKAETELQQATDMAPENILGHSLLAETSLHLKKPKDALKAYKMVLFFSPEHEKAQRVVKKLESLTADEFDDEVFEMKPLAESLPSVEISEVSDADIDPQEQEDEASEHQLERFLSLADAFIVRNDVDKAMETLIEAERRLGASPEINKRRQLLKKRGAHGGESEPSSDISPIPPRKQLYRDENINYLRILLKQISDRRQDHLT